MTNRLYAVLLIVAGAACSSDCVVPPCAAPIAAMVTVASAATRQPIANAVVLVNGDSTRAACNTTGSCFVEGEAGHYVLEARAPGYAPFQQTIDVTETESSGRCPSCPQVHTQTLQFLLTPAP